MLATVSWSFFFGRKNIQILCHVDCQVMNHDFWYLIIGQLAVCNSKRLFYYSVVPLCLRKVIFWIFIVHFYSNLIALFTHNWFIITITFHLRMHSEYLNLISISFSKRRCVLIWSSSMCVSFHILSLIMFVSDIEVPLYTSSTAASEYAFSTNTSSSYKHFVFFLFLPIDYNIYIY